MNNGELDSQFELASEGVNNRFVKLFYRIIDKGEDKSSPLSTFIYDGCFNKEVLKAN